MEENKTQIIVNFSAATAKIFERDLEAQALLHIFLKTTLRRFLTVQEGEDSLQQQVIDYIIKMDHRGDHPLNPRMSREANEGTQKFSFGFGSLTKPDSLHPKGNESLG